jgi:hypothetical protein
MDSLAPKFSMNSFFVRHVAHPRRMKIIPGIANNNICSVEDDISLPVLKQISYSNQNASSILNSSSNSFTKSDPSPNFKRKERAVPPQGIWKTYGMSMK